MGLVPVSQQHGFTQLPAVSICPAFHVHLLFWLAHGGLLLLSDWCSFLPFDRD